MWNSGSNYTSVWHSRQHCLRGSSFVIPNRTLHLLIVLLSLPCSLSLLHDTWLISLRVMFSRFTRAVTSSSFLLCVHSSFSLFSLVLAPTNRALLITFLWLFSVGVHAWHSLLDSQSVSPLLPPCRAGIELRTSGLASGAFPTDPSHSPRINI